MDPTELYIFSIRLIQAWLFPYMNKTFLSQRHTGFISNWLSASKEKLSDYFNIKEKVFTVTMDIPNRNPQEMETNFQYDK